MFMETSPVHMKDITTDECDNVMRRIFNLQEARQIRLVFSVRLFKLDSD